MSNPKRRNGQEAMRPVLAVTPAEINRRNREFWAPRPPSDSDATALAASSFRQGEQEGWRRATAPIRTARSVANKDRRNSADDEAIGHYRAWERRCAAVLVSLETSERLRKYLSTQKLSDRQKRRIRALAKDGRLEPLQK